jgi:hypothetical protein
LWARLTGAASTGAAARRLAAAAVFATVAGLPLVSDGALSNACKPPPAEPELVDESYPAHASSPLQSLRDHDVVFYGEVVVPTRPCSLGYCAGVKVLAPIKGQVEKTVLITVANAKDDRCGPDLFQHKGVRWVIFADTGTSKTGIKYMHAGFEGPSYPSIKAPDFSRLEADYRMLRAQLDDAIEARLGRPTRTR